MTTPIQDHQIALRANGVMPLNEFRNVVAAFADLIGALSDEIAGKDEVTWQLSGLEYGSAAIQIAGYAEDPMAVRRVVAAYRTVAVAAQERRVIPYSESVQAAVRTLTGVINDHVKGLEFLTVDSRTMVSAPIKAEATEAPVNQASWGSVRGKVQTISERNALSFTLYDSLFDLAVRCTVAADRRELLRDIWGKEVEVTGRVRRDPHTGRPEAISDVTEIEVIELDAPSGYRRARGILTSVADLPLPEERIRRLRDES